jgi:hypothetical protein
LLLWNKVDDLGIDEEEGGERRRERKEERESLSPAVLCWLL